MSGWLASGWQASWLAGWLADWRAGWLAGWLGGAKAEGTRVGEGNWLVLGPWGEDYRRGAAGNRHPWQLLGGLLLC